MSITQQTANTSPAPPAALVLGVNAAKHTHKSLYWELMFCSEPACSITRHVIPAQRLALESPEQITDNSISPTHHNMLVSLFIQEELVCPSEAAHCYPIYTFTQLFSSDPDKHTDHVSHAAGDYLGLTDSNAVTCL